MVAVLPSGGVKFEQQRVGARRMTPYWLLLPGFAWLTIFFLVPLFSLAQTSLMTANQPGVPEAGFTPGKDIALAMDGGDLGGAFLGLTLMEREKKIYLENPQLQPDLENESYIVGRLLKPEARKDIIEFLEQNEILPTSMMDVSDGISSEVLHLCKQSNLGCVVYEEKIPISDDSRRAAYKFGLDPTVCALNGGEDYELIFTMKQEDYDKITLNEEISVIGYMTDIEAGCKLHTKGGNTFPITAQGWNAFQK